MKFKFNKVNLKITDNKSITLFFELNKNKNADLLLNYSKPCSNLTYNNDNKDNYKPNNIIQHNNIIKIKNKDNNNINCNKNDINKTDIKIDNNELNDCPDQIQFISEITKDSCAPFSLVNSFIVFKTINHLIYLIYSTKNNFIICYNLLNQQKIITIKNTHKTPITNFRHYYDENNKRDLVLSISKDDNHIILWDSNNWKCIFNKSNIFKAGALLSACFLKDNNKIYIIAIVIQIGVLGRDMKK